jgi:hypothetical protein
MNQESTIGKKIAGMSRKTKAIWIATGLSPVLALVCFVIVALLPATDKPHFEDPIRSILTGIGVLGIAAPFCVGGYVLKQRAASSPYFEGTFIATAITLFGIVCLIAGLACIILGVYDLATMFVTPRPKPRFR